jgi:hypothetical protein
MGLRSVLALWRVASGYKSVVGGIVALVTAYLIQTDRMDPQLETLLLGLSTLLLGTGVAHKAVKAKKKPDASE